MGPLHTISAPAPALYVAGDRNPVASAYFAVTVDAAADLRAAPEYKNLPLPQRVSKAQLEQHGFLIEFLDPGLGAALDLRIVADSAASTPLSMTLLGRVWGGSTEGVSGRAEELRKRVHAALPRHLAAAPVADADAVARLLTPFPGAALDSAVITRRELIGLPSRPDAGVSYYYSAAAFNWSDDDWSAVYSALAASPVPVVLSVAVLPMPVPTSFAQTLFTLATFYGRLAREGELPTARYQGGQRLPPDAFAVDAERAFKDFAHRLSQKAFALRIQVSAPGKLPAGIVEAIAGAISPGNRAGSFPDHQAAPACDVRRPVNVAERRLAEYNLSHVDFRMLTGQPDIWGRPDPPDPQLAMLSVLGDARDASCAFRFPIAADGSVPGFRVRRDPSGHGASYQMTTGPAIRLGQVADSDREIIMLPLRSLTRHALIAGGPDSGKTTTALEILRQLWADHGIPFLVIEPGTAKDYRVLGAMPGLEDLEIVTVGDESGRPLRFNPFEVPTGTGVGEHTANLLACFTSAFGLSGPLPSIYRDALDLTYLRAGFLSSEKAAGSTRTWPTVAEFLQAMREVTDGLGYQGEVRATLEAAAVRRAQRLVRGVIGSTFLTSQRSNIGRLLDHPVLLELGSLGAADEQALMMALLLNAITEYNQSARGARGLLVHVTLVEEAHRLLARPAGGTHAPDAQARERAAEAFANRLTGSSAYGAGVILTERIPGKLVQDAVKNANLKIMHRLTAEDDRRYLGEAMGMDDGQQLFATRLRTGEALVYSDELTEAVQVSVTPAPGGPVSAVVVPAAAPPFDACHLCRAQCAYRGAALAMLNDPRTVDHITGALTMLAEEGGTPTEEAVLAGLTDDLLATVGRFAALPAANPGRGDAAFCLFLHVLASRSTRFPAAWPVEIAARLGIDQAPAEGDNADDQDFADHPWQDRHEG